VGRYWGDEKWGEGWGWANFWTDLDLMLIDLSISEMDGDTIVT
jgi:hypothetical protein